MKEISNRSARLFAFLVSVLLVSWNIPATVHADGGELDTTFGVGGKAVTDVGGSESGTAIAIQPDGKIVVAGSYGIAEETSGYDFVVARYLPTGILDTQFGFGGLNGVDFFGGRDIGHAVAVQPDGKIVVAGEVFNPATNNTDFGLARFNPDGNVDDTFGTGNSVATDFFGLADQAMGVAIQADGKIVAVGIADHSSAGNEGDLDLALARYNSDGILDPTFGSGGKVVITGPRRDGFYAVTIQPDGKILAAGYFLSIYPPVDFFALFRFNSDGSPDSSFGLNGMAMGTPGLAHSLLVQPDGSIILAGGTVSYVTAANNFGLMRFDSTGHVDPSFGHNGTVSTDFFGDRDVATAVAQQPDGKIIAAGFAQRSDGPDTSDFALARYNPDGSPDLTFGSEGKVTTDFFGGEDQAFSMALTPNGRILLAGYVDNGPSEDLALACYSMGALEEFPDFTLEMDHQVIHATPGEKLSIAVNIRRSGGFTGKVIVEPPDLSAEGIITRSPDPIKTKGTRVEWSFKIKGRTAPGPHYLTFVGRDTAGKQRTAGVVLLVE